MHRLSSLPLAALLVLGGACSEAVSPADRALDGPWTSGHTISGLAMGLTLSWTDDRLAGTGDMNAEAPDVHCGSMVVNGLTSVTLTATRPSSAEIRGTLAIVGSTSMGFEGTLSGSKIEIVLTAADGTGCSMALFQGLIP